MEKQSFILVMNNAQTDFPLTNRLNLNFPSTPIIKSLPNCKKRILKYLLSWAILDYLIYKINTTMNKIYIKMNKKLNS
jgi:hypothetical protein